MLLSETKPPQALEPERQTFNSGAWRDLLWLSLLCLALYGFALGWSPLANPDEARYAEIPREMLLTGDFVTPRLNGVKYFEKPPLTYWFVAAALKTFGPGEAAARATPALFAAIGVLMTYAAGRALAGRKAGLWAAVVQASALLYFAHARILLLDMAVSVLIAATCWCFLLGVREPEGRRRRLLFYGLYASAAGATLAKGLIGFLLPGAVMFLWLLVFNQWRRLRPMYLPTGLLIFGLLCVPWHLAVAWQNPEWARFYFIHEHWMRFTASGHLRGEPWWFYLPIILLGLFPWNGFLVTSVRSVLPVSWARRGEGADRLFPIVWAVFIVGFFSISKSKLIPYVLPAIPPLALLIGLNLATISEGRPAKWIRSGALGFSLIGGLIGVAALVLWFKPRLAGSPADPVALRTYLLAVGLLMVGTSLGATITAFRGRARLAFGFLIGGAAGFLMLLAAATPTFARATTRDLARAVAQQAGSDDLVLHYRDFFHDFVYYGQRFVGTVEEPNELGLALDAEARESGLFMKESEFHAVWSGPRQVFVVVKRSTLPVLTDQSGFRYRVFAETSRHVVITNQL